MPAQPLKPWDREYLKRVSRCDHPEVWRPLSGMPAGARQWDTPGYADLADEWLEIQAALKHRAALRRFLAGWLAESARKFAIETGQIEGLDTLRRGITEQLVAEGIAGVTGAHAMEEIEDSTLKGLLDDQQAAYNMLFGDVADGVRLTQHKIKTWHQLLTRHQAFVTGLTPDFVRGGMRKVHVPFEEKGVWKTLPNNPERSDGVVHQYCPPEQIQSEMDKFIDLHRRIEAENYPAEVEAAWMHHRFVRTHPFRDGNGRVSRMLMAYAYVRRGLPPPVITNALRDSYISRREDADRGDLRAFVRMLGALAALTLDDGVRLGRRILRGDLNRSNGRGSLLPARTGPIHSLTVRLPVVAS